MSKDKPPLERQEKDLRTPYTERVGNNKAVSFDSKLPADPQFTPRPPDSPHPWADRELFSPRPVKKPRLR